MEQATGQKDYSFLQGKKNDEIEKMMKDKEDPNYLDMQEIISDPVKRKLLFSGKLTATAMPPEGEEPPKPSGEEQQELPLEKEPPKSPPSEEDDWGGYGSKEKLLKATKDKDSFISGLQGKVQTYDVERSQLGQKVKDLESKIDNLPKAPPVAAPLAPKAEPKDVPVEELKLPTINPEDFSDPNLAKALQSQLDVVGKSYNSLANLHKQGKVNETKYESRITEMNDEIAKVKEFMNSAQKNEADRAVDAIKSQRTDSHSSLIKEIEKFQGERNLKTTRSFSELDADITNHGTYDTNNRFLHDPSHAAILPPKDLENHNLIMDLVYMCGNFDKNGVYQRNSIIQNLDEAYDVLQKRKGLPKEQQTDADKLKQKEAEEAKLRNTSKEGTGLPNSALGGEKLETMTPDQKTKRFKELNALGTPVLMQSPALFNEWKQLAAVHGIVVPQKLKPFPT